MASTPMCIDEQPLPYRKVIAEGEAELVHDVGEDDVWRDLYRRIAGRYVPQEAAEVYRRVAGVVIETVRDEREREAKLRGEGA